jgi:hypothetical protein
VACFGISAAVTIGVEVVVFFARASDPARLIHARTTPTLSR